jgi:hypothetical protein
MDKLSAQQSTLKRAMSSGGNLLTSPTASSILNSAEVLPPLDSPLSCLLLLKAEGPQAVTRQAATFAFANRVVRSADVLLFLVGQADPS